MPNTPRFHRRKTSSSPSPSTTTSSSSWFANLRNNVRLSNNANQYNNNNNDNDVGLNNKSRGQQHNGNTVANNYQLDDSLHRRSECTSASAATQLHSQHMNQTNHRHYYNHNHHDDSDDYNQRNPPNDEMGFLSSSPSWTDPEQLFSSPDDISVNSNNGDNPYNNNNEDYGEESSQEPSIFSADFLPPLFDNYISPNNNNHLNGGDDETCNNTITEIKKQRSKKAIRASTVGAFNTFLKALFGIGMLSNPAVLGEVGLVLGTFCHLFIIVGCAFACYLLLTARKLAVGEVREREWREEVEAEEYNEYLRVREEKILRRNNRRGGDGVLNKERQYKSMMDLHQFGNENDGDVNGSLNRNDNGDWNNGDFDYTNGYGTPIRPPLGMSIHSYNNNNNNNSTTSAAAAASTMQTPDGWGRCQNSMAQATNDVLSPSEGVGPSCEPCAIGAGTTTYNVMSGETESSNNNDDNDGIRLVPPPPLIDDDVDDNNNTMTNNGVNNTKNRTIEPTRQHNPLFQDPPNLHRKSGGFKRNTSSQPLTSNYHRFEDTQGSSFNNMMRHSNSQTSLAKLTNAALMAPPKKSKKVRLVTYGDVAKYLAGPTFAQLIIFTIVAVHLMFASGMLHIAIENLCYIAGWDRLGFSYADVMYTGDDDYYGNNLYYGSYQYRGRVLREENDGNSGSNDHQSGSHSHSGSRDDNSRDNVQWHSINIEDAEEEYAKWEGPDFVGRLAMASLLFPIIHGLLQIPSLKELATISTMGLITYALGCVGSMMYSAFVLTDFQPFVDRPDDLLAFKWSGIPTYVATTIYAIEGINLALPTVNTLEGNDRASNLLHKNKGSGAMKDDKSNKAIKMVVMAVFCYGCVTLFVSWMGLAGGLGGGIGTIHEQDGCRDVTYCLNSVKVQYVYMLSLGVALVLTLPVILYPSTEMLEIWLDERADVKRRKLETEAAANKVPNYQDMTTKQLKKIRRSIMEAEASANNVPNPENMTNKQLKAVRRHIRSKSLMDDDATAKTAKLVANQYQEDEGSNSVVPMEHEPQEDVYIEMTTIDGSNNGDLKETYTPPHCSPTCQAPEMPTAEEPVPVKDVSITSSTPPIRGGTTDNSKPTKDTAETHERKIRAKRKLKYWKLRMFLAFLICLIGTLEGSFPQIVKIAEVIRGVGLSIAGLISPPLLYMSAVGGRFSAGMASAMALLIGLGLFNIVLVLMSAFGGKDYIIEEGPGHYHDSFYELDE